MMNGEVVAGFSGWQGVSVVVVTLLLHAIWRGWRQRRGGAGSPSSTWR